MNMTEPYTLYNYTTRQWDRVDSPRDMDYSTALQYCPELQKGNLIDGIKRLGDSPWLALLFCLQKGG